MINTEKLFQALSDIQPLSRGFKEALSSELNIISYPKNHFLVQMQAISQYAYFLMKGLAVAYHFVDGRRIVTAFFKPFDFVFSPVSYCEQTKATENIQLTVEGHLIALSSESANKLFYEYPEANVIARSITAQYHKKTQERQIDHHYLRAWDRYVKLQSEIPGIEMHASQDLIASYLNITPQFLCRMKHVNN